MVEMSLPCDLALNIISLLEASDVCSLGSCSRSWRDLCAWDCVWAELYRRRWPASDGARRVGGDSKSEAGGGECSADGSNGFPSPTQGWRALYIEKHRRMASAASSVISFVEEWSQNESLEVGYYRKAIVDLGSMELGFKDVQLFLLTKKHNVLLNLIGLHYSIFWLEIPPTDAREALQSCHVSEREVVVSWFKLGRWFYGFRLPDERRSRKVSLAELTMAKEEEVLGVLNRGAVHEVLRVQISLAPTSSTGIM